MDRIYSYMLAATFLLLLAPVMILDLDAQSIPGWIKNVALWYGEGEISESEFIQAMKYLIENKIIVIEMETLGSAAPESINVIIPNGNAEVGNAGFYLPLNAQIVTGTTVVWINDDVVPHTIQSQDEQGNVIGLFNSDVLETGDRFVHTFDEKGTYNYFCTLHPWRVGTVTVS